MKFLRYSSDLLSATLLAVMCAGVISAAHAQTAASVQSAPKVQAPTISAQFVSMLNTKSAKAGDPVVARISDTLKLKDLEIPKGSKIVGAVAAVRPRQGGSGDSALAIRFDHVELKNGAILRIAGLIVAIGERKDSDGLGANSVLARGGAGSTPGIDASMEVGHTVNRDDIPMGSSMEGVALGMHLTADGASELHGVHRDIRVDSDTVIKVALYRTAA